MKFTILVVDDEKNIREGLGEFLKLEGYNILLASDGTEGAALADSGEADLVITDLRMPGMSGNE
ncbi:MAG TPA: response regulator, partial [Spirochaetales bacterium]|nr:response regulator [Spirochaetales bacterium]